MKSKYSLKSISKSSYQSIQITATGNTSADGGYVYVPYTIKQCKPIIIDREYMKMQLKYDRIEKLKKLNEKPL